MVTPNPVAQLESTQVHRDTYIAVLNSVLKTRGDKRQFASAIGITTQYLNELLDPLGFQTPSKTLAQRIADTAPLPAESKQNLLYHLRSTNPYSLELTPTPDNHTEGLTPEQVRDVILIIGNYEHRALYSTDTDTVRNAYTMLLRLGTWILARLDPAVYPQHYVGISASLHGTASTLNMPVKSMWFARAGLAVAQNMAFWHAEELQCHHAAIRINAWGGLATSWHNLGQPEKALECVRQAKQIAFNLPTKTERNRWLPSIVMEELNTYTIHPDFSIKAAERARDQGLSSLYSSVNNRSSIDLIASLIERNMVESYVQHGTPRSLRKAERYIEQHFDEQQLSRYGPLIHTMHLRTCAKLHRKTRNYIAFNVAIHKAGNIAKQAGLIHQQAEIQQELHDISVD